MSVFSVNSVFFDNILHLVIRFLKHSSHHVLQYLFQYLAYLCFDLYCLFFFLGFFLLSLVYSMVEIFTKYLTLSMKSFNCHKIVFLSHRGFTASSDHQVGFPCGSAGKESFCDAGDLGSIPGLGRPPGAGNGYPLQYSCLENSTDDKQLISRIYKQLLQLNSRKINDPIKKWAKEHGELVWWC